MRRGVGERQTSPRRDTLAGKPGTALPLTVSTPRDTLKPRPFTHSDIIRTLEAGFLWKNKRDQ